MKDSEAMVIIGFVGAILFIIFTYTQIANSLDILIHSLGVFGMIFIPFFIYMFKRQQEVKL